MVDIIELIVLSGLGALLLLIFGVLAWTMYGMYRSLSNAKSGLAAADEGVKLARYGVEMHQKGLELAEQSLAKQDEIIRLLNELVNDSGRFKSTQS